ncbi:hypothetical protein B7494_g3621 [Chlorociboria aeruginascens]|nr:hypothetical protein B7494_g3621 [Chlorociboria aeruginascens]
MEVPLSSPSASQPQSLAASYFPSKANFNSNSNSNSTSTSTSTQSSAPTSAPQSFPPPAQSQSQSQPQAQAQTQQQRPPPVTDAASPFLRDFNLVAEAAKRAQMAVLMRDMEAVGLS